MSVINAVSRCNRYFNPLFFSLIVSLVTLTGCSKNETIVNPVENSNGTVSSPPIENYYPIPSAAQVKWQESELVMFFHYGMNTFTNVEWGDGTEKETTFAPVSINTNQWVQTAKDAGFKYLILTAKHHDGFCLWPSKYTTHSIKCSPYKNGNGDVVKEFSDACKTAGVNFGVYLSPWDRHESTFGSAKYNEYYANQLTELMTKYGDVGEVWLDGANGDSTRHQDYDLNLFYSTVKYYQPNTLIAIMGPDINWAGNEDGVGYETEWSVKDPNPYIHGGTANKIWWPSECDVSIRPGWFYHADQDNQVKSANKLIDIYFNTVGRNANLLLNIPPNKEGNLSEVDVSTMKLWRAKIDQIFSKNVLYRQKIESNEVRSDDSLYSPAMCLDDNKNTFWAAGRWATGAELIITLDKPEKFNILKLEEAFQFGQRIELFEVFADNNGSWNSIAAGTTVGRTRLLRINPVTTSKIKIVIHAKASPTLRTIGAYYYEF